MANEKKNIGERMDGNAKNAGSMGSSGAKRAKKNTDEGQKIGNPAPKRIAAKKSVSAKASVAKIPKKNATPKLADEAAKPKAKKQITAKKVGKVRNGTSANIDAEKIKTVAESSVRTTLAPQVVWPFPVGKKP